MSVLGIFSLFFRIIEQTFYKEIFGMRRHWRSLSLQFDWVQILRVKTMHKANLPPVKINLNYEIYGIGVKSCLCYKSTESLLLSEIHMNIITENIFATFIYFDYRIMFRGEV